MNKFTLHIVVKFDVEHYFRIMPFVAKLLDINGNQWVYS